LNIAVAALMTPAWAARKLAAGDVRLNAKYDRVVVPGYCRGDLGVVEEAAGCSVERGPKDVRDLPRHFGRGPGGEDYGEYTIEIIAEINHAPELTTAGLVAAAKGFAADGADVIDVGCNPDATWGGVGEAVRALRAEGLRVSIDTFNAVEAEAAVAAGAELVLSVNGSHVERVGRLGVEVVVIPEDPRVADWADSMARSVEVLEKWGAPYRLDPVLEPIGFGFADSLRRYWQTRERWGEARMMMGVGNLTELTGVDSAGVNVVLAGFCEELGISSVLTTAVVSWARSSVKELDLARRVTHYAKRHGHLPKHVEPGLVMLRDDAAEKTHGAAGLARIQGMLKDRNFRIFAEGGEIHVMNSALHVHGEDPFVLFAQLAARGGRDVDASHAFYLGYEMAKAVTALTLGKHYEQDQALDWGFLTREEISRMDREAQGDEK
jgi:dihydropteroate synthase-like protein